MFLSEPFYFLLDPGQLILFYCGFVFICFSVPVLHLDLTKLVVALKDLEL
jgi:hypothetical protein